MGRNGAIALSGAVGERRRAPGSESAVAVEERGQLEGIDVAQQRLRWRGDAGVRRGSGGVEAGCAGPGGELVGRPWAGGPGTRPLPWRGESAGTGRLRDS